MTDPEKPNETADKGPSFYARMGYAVSRYGYNEVVCEIATALRDQAVACLGQNRHTDAIRLLEAIYSLIGGKSGFDRIDNPSLAFQVTMSLASAYAKIGRQEEAKHYFLRCIDADPHQTLNSIDVVLEYVGRHGSQHEILDVCERVRAIQPGNQLARLLYHSQMCFPSYVDKACEGIERSANRSDKPNAVFYVPVWGHIYAQRMMDFVLPAWLAPGNIPALAERYNLSIQFLVDAEAASVLVSNGRFSALARYGDITLHKFDAVMEETRGKSPVNRFILFSFGHYMILEAARLMDADVFLGFPDNVMDETFYASAADRLSEEKDLVLCVGMRVLESDVADELRAMTDVDYRLSLPVREAQEMVVRNVPSSWFVDSEYFCDNPFFLTWPVGDTGVLVHATHMQPYAVRANAITVPLTPSVTPLDATLSLRHFQNMDRVEICTDSSMVTFDISDTPLISEDEAPNQPRSFSTEAFAQFLQEYDTDHMRDLFRAPVLFNSTPDAPEAQTVMQDASSKLEAIFKKIDDYRHEAPDNPWRDVEKTRKIHSSPG